jgi:hypothetical protein
LNLAESKQPEQGSKACPPLRGTGKKPLYRQPLGSINAEVESPLGEKSVSETLRFELSRLDSYLCAFKCTIIADVAKTFQDANGQHASAPPKLALPRDLEIRGQKLFYEIRASDISTASEMRLKTPNQKKQGRLEAALQCARDDSNVRPLVSEPKF